MPTQELTAFQELGKVAKSHQRRLVLHDTLVQEFPHRLSLLISAYSSPPPAPSQPCDLCLTSIDGSPPGSPFPGILQARSLEWVATLIKWLSGTDRMAE